MIRVEKPKFREDFWCKCCNKEDESVMEVKFFVKNKTNVSTSMSLCRTCRTELLVKLKDTIE